MDKRKKLRSVIVAGWASLCMLICLLPTAAVAAGAAQSARPAWWSYDRPAKFTSVTSQILVPMDDGVGISCELLQPGADSIHPAVGRFPGLISNFTPYGVAQGVFASTDGVFFAEHGYDVLVCSARGTGSSQGTFECCSTPREIRDGYNLVEWLAHQSYSTGRIGMEGDSYGGFNTIGVAATHPPNLYAIAPQQFPSSLYDDNVYPGGIEAAPGLGNRDDWPNIIGVASGFRVNGQTVEAEFEANRTLDAFWANTELASKLSQISVPFLNIAAGPTDIFFRNGLQTLLDSVRKMPNVWTIVGPWAHALWSGSSYEQLPQGVLLAWFDRYVAGLSGVPGPSTNERLLSYEQPVGTGPGWESVGSYPPPSSTTSRLYLSPQGTLVAAKPAAGQVDYVGAAGHPSANSGCLVGLLETCNRPYFSGGGYVTFSGAPFTSDVSITGSIGVNLDISANYSDSNIYAEIFDVAPDGSATFIDDGSLLASHRYSEVTPTPLVPGQKTQVSFAVGAFDWHFKAGHSLGLRLSAGPADEFLPAASSAVTTTIYAGSAATSLTVPESLRLP